MGEGYKFMAQLSSALQLPFCAFRSIVALCVNKVDGASEGRRKLPMAEQSEADTLFDRLLALNREAFAARRYPTAYYALVAAMCEAEAAQDVPGLSLVQTVAEAQAAPGERPVASPPTSTYRTLLTILAKRIHTRVLLIQRLRIRHDIPPCC